MRSRLLRVLVLFALAWIQTDVQAQIVVPVDRIFGIVQTETETVADVQWHLVAFDDDVLQSAQAGEPSTAVMAAIEEAGALSREVVGLIRDLPASAAADSPLFFTRFFQLYSPHVRQWILFNQGTIEQYFMQLKAAYQAGQSHSLMLAGFDDCGQRNGNFEQLMNLIARDPDSVEQSGYFSGVVLTYAPQANIEQQLAECRAMLFSYGWQQKPIWMVEFTPGEADEVSQPDDVMLQTLAISLASRVERIALHESHTTLLANYSSIAHRLRWADRLDLYTVPEASVVIVSFPRYTIYIVWNKSGTWGEFWIDAEGLTVPAVSSNAVGEYWSIPLVQTTGAQVVSVLAPPPGQADSDPFTPDGHTRIITIDGAPRRVWFRTLEGRLIQLH